MAAIVVVGFEVVDMVPDEAIPGVVADLAVVVEAVDVVVVVAVVVAVAAEGVADVVVLSALSVGRHHFSPPVLTAGTAGAVSSADLGEEGERVEEGALKPLGAGDGLDGLRPRRRFANSAKLRSEYLLSPTA
jgi:hypothetical protein